MAGPWENYAPAAVPSADGPWSRYKTESMGVGEDIAKSLGSGLVRGTAGIAGVGGDISKGMEADLAYLDSKGAIPQTLGGLITGERPLESQRRAMLKEMPEWLRKYHERPAPKVGSKEIMAGIDKATGAPVTSYEPSTGIGEAARTVGEFIPGAVMSPGGSLVGNTIRYGVVPALTSEGLGALARKYVPQLEGAAKVVGAVGGTLGASLTRRASTGARAIREQLPEGITPQIVDQASALIDDAQRQGVTLSWPEALSQVAGRPVLTNTLRHLEAAPQTEARMAEFFGDRAPAIDDAARQQFDNVAPVNQRPSTIGPAVGDAAETAVNRERQMINLQTEPHYTAASPQRLSPQQMAPVLASPEWQAARDAVRNDPQLNRNVAHLPDDSVGFLNEVKKHIDQQAANARSPVAQNQSVQRAAGLETDASTVRDAATRASPDYAIALTEQARLRERYLAPLLQGPLGKIASKDTTTKAAIDALFPTQPLANSAQEIGSTVRTLAGRNPGAARDLVRAHLEGTFNEASQALQSGANQMGGAKFRAVLVGNPQQAANLEAAVRALPNGDQIWPGFNRFLDVLEATGTRQNVGSRTAYNAEMLKGASASGVIGETAKAVANPVRGAQFLADKYERWRLGSNLNELADILTNPAAVGQLRAISRMPVGGTQAANVALRIGQIANATSLKSRSE